MDPLNQDGFTDQSGYIDQNGNWRDKSAPANCKLCGAPTCCRYDKQAGWNKYHLKPGPNYYHTTWDELFNGNWNKNLELFCSKHVSAIFQEYLYWDGATHIRSVMPYSTEGPSFTYETPTDEHINRYLIKFLSKVGKRLAKHSDAVVCQHIACLKFAINRDGIWLCGQHGSVNEKNFLLLYGSEGQRFENLAATASMTIFNQWKKELTI